VRARPVRARDLGIRIGALPPGPAGAITDVAGVRVGHTTLVEGERVRTGVTVVLPHDGNPGSDPVFAGCHRLNGNGERVPLPERPPGRQPGAGSIIVLVATDAPPLPGQCDRLAQRAGFGVARTGGVGEHASGDLVLAFATGNRGLPVGESGPHGAVEVPLRMLSNAYVNPLFDAVIDATEEAIVNAPLAARTTSGFAGTAHALPAEALVAAMTSLGRPPG
jgi:L-aminopeptidase/D-esterase-like protein